RGAGMLLADIQLRANLNNLVQLARRHSFLEVRQKALITLGDIGSLSVVGDLLDLLRLETRPELLDLIIRALGRCGDDEMVPILIDFAMTHDGSRFTATLNDALTQLGERRPDGTPELDPDFRVDRGPGAFEDRPVPIDLLEIGSETES